MCAGSLRANWQIDMPFKVDSQVAVLEVLDENTSIDKQGLTIDVIFKNNKFDIECVFVDVIPNLRAAAK